MDTRSSHGVLAFRVGGVILVPSLNPKAPLERLAKTGTPTVILNRPVEDERFDQVMVDHREAVREVVDRLIDSGHKKIVLASQFPTLSVTRWRVAAMRETVKNVGPRSRSSPSRQARRRSSSLSDWPHI